jgi:DNA polymerase II small subunit
MGADKRIARQIASSSNYGPRRVDGDIPDLSASWSAKAEDYTTDITPGYRVGETRQTGSFDDIVGLFHDRYEKLSRVLIHETGKHPSGTIKHIVNNWTDYTRKPATILGIVMSIRRTKSGGRMVEIEDVSDTITVFIRADDPAAGSLLHDDVIAVTGTFESKSGEMFWVNEVQYPDILPGHMNKGGAEFDPVSIGFISDLHYGSKYFKEKEWNKMMKWLNSDAETAKNLKYLVIPGDGVDGIGIYPGHENNLSETDVYKQYSTLASMLDELPDHITPILSPGNHDAVRPAEPQPVLEADIQQDFNSAIHTGNPGRVNLSGLDVLTYHGKGIDDMVPLMNHVSYDRPAEAMKEMLRKRHMAPLWGERNALSPEEEDQMVIMDKPDIFVTGHTHAHQVEWYRGIANRQSRVIKFAEDGAK